MWKWNDHHITSVGQRKNPVGDSDFFLTTICLLMIGSMYTSLLRESKMSYKIWMYRIKSKFGRYTGPELAKLAELH